VNPAAAAERFYSAACTAAGKSAYKGDVEQLLIRIGLLGLMVRTVADAPVPTDSSMLRLQKLYQVLLSERALALSAAFRAAGIRHFFAKGIALLGKVYRPGDRFLADMDLYVDRQSRDEAIAVMRDSGYAQLPDSEQAGPRELRSTLAMQQESSAEIDQVIVDLHWALDPVERLLPRRQQALPERIWDGVTDGGELVVPDPEHHAAILVHHIVHTDLLHVRSLLDLAFVFATIPLNGGHEFVATCEELGVGRFAGKVAELLVLEFGVERRAALGGAAVRPSGMLRSLTLDSWLTMVARGHPDEDSAITVRRIMRRLKLLDHGGAWTLWQDLLFPPRAFLLWRWNSDTLSRARLRHYRQLVRKSVGI